MRLDQRLHRQIRLQNLLFIVLFLALVGLLGGLSQRYHYTFDWTAQGRHSLSEASIKVLATLDHEVEITAFARENNELRSRIQDLVARYQRRKPDIHLNFVNPDLYPDRVRELGITADGELVVAYGARTEKVQDLNEQSLTSALLRLAKQTEEQILFLEGHGERSPLGQANFDLGQFGRTLENLGFKVNVWNLAKNPDLPENTSVLVIASPQTAYLPGEVERIMAFLERGGALLWLAEPEDLTGLDPLAQALGIHFLPGTVVDPSSQALGIRDPTFVLAADYPIHPVTQELRSLSLFPRARPLEASSAGKFSAEVIIKTLPRTWNETGPLEGEIQLDPNQGEREGPLTLGLALTRKAPNQKTDQSEPQEQRAAVIGDGDFLANAYLGNGNNLDLGLNLIRWLTHNDQLITIPARTAPDNRLDLSSSAMALIGLGFLIFLPLTLVSCGFLIWWQRRRA
ncbi:MAG: GldG family protein [Methylohalobius sp.]|nr:GldG family protein [Methylohalobius sp.]